MKMKMRLRDFIQKLQKFRPESYVEINGESNFCISLPEPSRLVILTENHGLAKTTPEEPTLELWDESNEQEI